MIRAGVVGAIGYAGRELIRLLGIHPETGLVAAVELEGGKAVGEVMPALDKTTPVVLETFDAQQLAKKCDVVFMALELVICTVIGLAVFYTAARVLRISELQEVIDWVRNKIRRRRPKEDNA